MLTRRWARPAVKTPDGREPGMRMLPRLRSLQPIARMTARASTRTTPVLEDTQYTTWCSSSCLMSRTVAPQRAGMPRASTFSWTRWANSGPESSSLNSMRPKPLWMHCMSMPPNSSSRSMMMAEYPLALSSAAADMPAAPPPMTAASYRICFIAHPSGRRFRRRASSLPHSSCRFRA